MFDKISNETIVLERLKLSDSESVFQAVLNSKKEISPWLSWLNSGYNQKACDDFIKIQINNWNTGIEYTYAIKNHSNQILGMISLHVFDSQNNVASIGYWMDTKFTSKGLCTKALKLLVKKSLLMLNLIRIEVVVALNNVASQKVAINAGGTFESIQKNRIKLHGKAVDAHMYCFIPSVLSH